jgi:hypothetical protein
VARSPGAHIYHHALPALCTVGALNHWEESSAFLGDGSVTGFTSERVSVRKSSRQRSQERPNNKRMASKVVPEQSAHGTLLPDLDGRGPATPSGRGRTDKTAAPAKVAVSSVESCMALLQSRDAAVDGNSGTVARYEIYPWSLYEEVNGACFHLISGLTSGALILRGNRREHAYCRAYLLALIRWTCARVGLVRPFSPHGIVAF